MACGDGESTVDVEGEHDGTDFNDRIFIAINDDGDPEWNEWRRKRGNFIGRRGDKAQHLGWTTDENTSNMTENNAAAAVIFDADLSEGYCALLPELGKSWDSAG